MIPPDAHLELSARDWVPILICVGVLVGMLAAFVAWGPVTW